MYFIACILLVDSFIYFIYRLISARPAGRIKLLMITMSMNLGWAIEKKKNLYFTYYPSIVIMCFIDGDIYFMTFYKTGDEE